VRGLGYDHYGISLDHCGAHQARCSKKGFWSAKNAACILLTDAVTDTRCGVPHTGFEEIGTRLAIQPHHTSPKRTYSAVRRIATKYPARRTSGLSDNPFW